MVPGTYTCSTMPYTCIAILIRVLNFTGNAHKNRLGPLALGFSSTGRHFSQAIPAGDESPWRNKAWASLRLQKGAAASATPPPARVRLSLTRSQSSCTMRVPTGSSRRSVIKWRQPVASWAAGHPLGCPSQRTSWGLGATSTATLCGCSRTPAASPRRTRVPLPAVPMSSRGSTRSGRATLQPQAAVHRRPALPPPPPQRPPTQQPQQRWIQSGTQTPWSACARHCTCASSR